MSHSQSAYTSQRKTPKRNEPKYDSLLFVFVYRISTLTDTVPLGFAVVLPSQKRFSVTVPVFAYAPGIRQSAN